MKLSDGLRLSEADRLKKDIELAGTIGEVTALRTATMAVKRRQQAEDALAEARRELDKVKANAAAEIASARASAESGDAATSRSAELERQVSSLISELADAKAETKGLERTRSALEKDAAAMRAEHATTQAMLAKVLAELHAVVEAFAVRSAQPFDG